MTCIVENKRRKKTEDAADLQCLSRFKILSFVGQGAHGAVSSAIDLVTKEKVAIKKLSKTFQNLILAKRTLRELKFLRLLRHENIISVRGVVTPAKPSFDEVHIVTELLDTDLSAIIRSPQPLTDDHCKFLMYQLFRGVDYMHSRGVLHRDLKPKNIVVNRNCELKICDLGLARCDMRELQSRVSCMTDYVATRWYRSPEVILGWNRYTSALDMWSTGCILGELLLRKPLLQGRDPAHQLKLIVELLGSRPEEELQRIKSEDARQFIRDLPRSAGVQWESVLPGVQPEAIDLLRKLLVFDPEKRISAKEALAHPYFHALHQKLKDRGPKDADLLPLSKDDFAFELVVLSESDLRRLVHEEILRHNPLGTVRAVATPSDSDPASLPLLATARPRRPSHAPITSSRRLAKSEVVGSLPPTDLPTSLESSALQPDLVQGPSSAQPLQGSTSQDKEDPPRGANPFAPFGSSTLLPPTFSSSSNSNSNSASNSRSNSASNSRSNSGSNSPPRDSVRAGCPCLVCIAQADPTLWNTVLSNLAGAASLLASRDSRRPWDALARTQTLTQTQAHSQNPSRVAPRHDDGTRSRPTQRPMSTASSHPGTPRRNSTPPPSCDSQTRPPPRHPSSLYSTTTNTTTTTTTAPAGLVSIPLAPSLESYPSCPPTLSLIPTNMPPASSLQEPSQFEHAFCSPSLARFLRDSAMCTIAPSSSELRLQPQLPIPPTLSPQFEDRQNPSSAATQANAPPKAGPSSTSSSCATRLGGTVRTGTGSEASSGVRVKVGAGAGSNSSSPARVPSYVLTSPPSSIRNDVSPRTTAKRFLTTMSGTEKPSSNEAEVRARKRICY